MSFCTKCGNQIPENAKFCTRCGQKVAVFTPAPQQTPVTPAPETAPIYEAPAAPVYEAPAAPVYEAPAAPVYEAPAPEAVPFPAYEAPKSAYAEPAPEAVPFPAYEAPKSAYAEPAPKAAPFPAYEAPTAVKQPEPPVYQPPVYQAPQAPVYQPPVQNASAPAQNAYDVPWQNTPAKKKSGGKIGAIIACVLGGVAVLAAIIIGLILVLNGLKGKGDPNLGMYEAVSCDAYGMELGVDDEWIELKSGGKAVLKLMGEEYNCKWSLDGEDLTIKQAGDEYDGTLADGMLTIDFGSMTYTYVMEGQDPSVVAPTQEPESLSHVGTWTLVRAEGGDADEFLNEDMIALLEEMGMVIYVELYEDGTGVMSVDDFYTLTWHDNTIVLEDGTEATFAVVDGELLVESDGTTLVFTSGDITDIPMVEPTEAEPEETEPAETEPEVEDEMKAIREYWEGEWYGWWIIYTGEGYFADMEDTGWDAYARIKIYDDGTGDLVLWDSDTSADSPLAECEFNVESGISDAGVLVSDSGYFIDTDLTYADWYVDPASSVVDMFDDMIAIYGTYEDPDDSESYCDYYIILRPWGMYWDDVYEGDTSETIYDNMMPFEYGNWYTPLLRAGVTEMPNSFEEGEALLEEAE